MLKVDFTFQSIAVQRFVFAPADSQENTSVNSVLMVATSNTSLEIPTDLNIGVLLSCSLLLLHGVNNVIVIVLGEDSCKEIGRTGNAEELKPSPREYYGNQLE